MCRVQPDFYNGCSGLNVIRKRPIRSPGIFLLARHLASDRTLTRVNTSL
jgi:hypothetical protein